MPWHVITREYESIEGRSSALFSRDIAIGFACELIDAGATVLRIEGPGEEIPGDVVAERCAARRRRR